MNAQAKAEVQSRVDAGNTAQAKTRAVDSLERALWQWRSQRKIDGADSSLMVSVENFTKAFEAAQ